MTRDHLIDALVALMNYQHTLDRAADDAWNRQRSDLPEEINATFRKECAYYREQAARMRESARVIGEATELKE